MIDEGQKQGEDITLLKTLYDKLAELSAIAMVEGLKSFPYYARLVAMNLSLFENQKAVCIGDLDYGLAVDDAGAATQDSIYEIAVNGLPIPELSSWQDILAFKSENANQRRLLAFHVWVSDMSKTNQTRAEMTDKIEYLKQEYIHALNVAKINHYPGIFKGFVVGTAALVENCAKFRLQELAKGAFKIAEAKAQLLEAERNAPGRELSYLVEASRSLR